MQTDEQAIRTVIDTWHAASALGDLGTLMNLMDEDVVFLQAGRPPLHGREAFATAFQSGLQLYRIDAMCLPEEVRVSGDFAHCRNRLSVTITPLAGGGLKRLSGYTLSIFRRNSGGHWVLSRDANLLTPEA